MARQVARRHQRERIAGILVVCLGLVVLTVAVIALREPNGHVSGSGASNVADGTHTSAPPSSPSAPETSASSTHRPSPAQLKSIPLVVLNNSTVTGLAQRAAQQFEAGGWTVTHYDNLQNDIISTCAYYDPSVPHARAAAKALQRQFPGIDRVKPKFAELPAGPVVVVLTGDYSTT
jgi:LytR cell envelope-related transcriptional attenuator